jgi:hypothetical protein
MAKKKIEALDVRVAGKGMTKEERAAREEELCDALFSVLMAMNERQAWKWRHRVNVLRAGLTAAAVRRATRRADQRAADHPPGYVASMASMDLFEEIARDYGIDAGDADALYGAVAQMDMFQLAAQRGPFHQAAEDFGLTRPPSVVNAVREFVASDLAAREGKPVCDCPNCRPRTDAELN